ncbi:MAG TPA: TIGR02444 family protein [Caulobacteraceae bacterium]|nr:TIGR02444 family protein [Caulobacteraceae bacterium]
MRDEGRGVTTGEALWPYALELYARPGVEALLLELQDAHSQCVPYLIWSLWLAASGRPLDAARLAAGAELARAWQDAAVGPLRTLRRDLKRPGRAAMIPARRRLREKVAALELEAERMLLQMLQEASPATGVAAAGPLAHLEAATRAWGREAPRALVERLASITA